MSVTIHPETPTNFPQVYELIRAAFANEPYSDQKEHELVARLRSAEAFDPALSLVAERDGEIVGYILFTPVRIVGETESAESLALAPVAVHPEHQGRGIGGQLIRRGHEAAMNRGYASVVLLGHADYYPRFGYAPAERFGIRAPFDVPAENFMAAELKPGALEGVTGVVEYPAAFGI